MTQARLHVLQHVPFEDEARVGAWAKERGLSVSRTPLFESDVMPGADDFDWLVVMGGPMGVHDERRFPWLTAEKRLVGEAIAAGKVVLGVCLGAQLIADAMGARVYRHSHREIGWFPVKLTAEGETSPLFGELPREFTAFHWHGDIFDIPADAVRTAESEGCVNQAFEYEGRVVGLQFHLESTAGSVQALVENCREDLVEGPYVQSEDGILSLRESSGGLNAVMDRLLDGLAGNAEGDPK
jgi:GMP synthase-like glutamine amidotransferase